MKSTFVQTLLFCLLLTSFQVEAQYKRIKGEGPMVTKTLELDPFTAIDLGTSANVLLTQGDRQSVEVNGQQNIIDRLKTQVSNGKWNIQMQRGSYSYKEMTIKITIPKLTGVSVSGSGDVRGSNRFTNVDDLKIRVGGSGNVVLDMEANDINTAIMGSGNINLEGQASNFEVKVSGSGNVKAQNLTARNCKVQINGSGNAKVNVDGELNVLINGSGNVVYKGDAKVRSKINGSGDVRGGK